MNVITILVESGAVKGFSVTPSGDEPLTPVQLLQALHQTSLTILGNLKEAPAPEGQQ